MEKTKVMIVGTNDNRIYEIKSLLRSDTVVFVGFVHLDETVLDKIASLKPHVVILQCDHNYDIAISISQKIYTKISGCAVIFLCENFDTRVLENVMLAGVRKVLQFPIDAETLSNHIELAHYMEKTRLENLGVTGLNNMQSRIITIFGTKGGIGKSTITSNLAVLLAKTGKKVAVIDADLQFGDINVYFDMDPKDTISELSQGSDAGDIDAIKRMMVLHFSGVSVVCAPKSPEYADYVSLKTFETMINTMRPFYDYILIDTAPVFNDMTISAIESANLVLMLTVQDISTLRNTKLSLNILESLQQKEKTEVIINRSTKGLISLKDMQRVLNVPLKNVVTFDFKTATMAHNKGVPFVLDTPKAEISKDLRKLADYVVRTIDSKD